MHETHRLRAISLCADTEDEVCGVGEGGEGWLGWDVGEKTRLRCRRRDEREEEGHTNEVVVEEEEEKKKKKKGSWR